MNVLEETLEELRNLEMVGSQSDYSTRWLNKSPRYFSMMKATRKKPSVDVLGRLAANLKQCHEVYRTSKFGELRERAEWIYPIVRKVWTEFYNRALERKLN